VTESSGPVALDRAPQLASCNQIEALTRKNRARLSRMSVYALKSASTELGIPESSQSLEPPLAELVEETERRREMGSISSFLIGIEPGG